MSFVKHAIFVNDNAPKLEDNEEIIKHILDRLTIDNILITKGIIDALDHSSPKQLVGSKLGIDATNDKLDDSHRLKSPISDRQLLEKMQNIDKNIKELKQYMQDTINPICFISVDKKESMQNLITKLNILKEHIKILIIVDSNSNFIDNPYMLIWRVANNIDALRDVKLEPFISVDATNKNRFDNYTREWPKDTLCDKKTLDNLQEKGLIDIDDKFINRFGLL